MTVPLAVAPGLGLAVALALGAAAGSWVLALAVMLAQALVVTTWHRVLEVPGATGGAVVAGVAALAADGLVLDAEGDRPLAALPAVLALSFVAGLVHQIVRRDGRERLNASLSATVALCVLTVPAATYVAVEASEAGAPLVTAAAVPAGIVAAATALRRERGLGWWVGPAAVAAGAAVGLVLSVSTDLGLAAALAVAAAAGAAAWVADDLVGRTSRPHPALAGGLSQALAAPVAYVLGRLLVG